MTAVVTDLKRPFTARLALAAIFFANGLGIGSWATAIAPVKAILSLSDAQLSFALLAMAAGAIVMMPLAGLLALHLGGTGRLLRVSSTLFAVSLCLPGLTPNLAALILATLLLGLANGLMEVPMNTHATAIEQRWGAAIMSSFHAAWSCGTLAGATLGGLLIRAGVDPQWQLAISGCAVLLVVLPSLPKIGAGVIIGQSQAFALPERRLLGLCLIALIALLAEGAMTDWSAVYLTSVLAFTPAVAASGYAVYAGSMLIGRLFGDLVVRRAGRRQIILLGAAMTAAGLLLAVASASLPITFAGLSLVGLGLSNMVPAIFSASAAMGSTPAIGISMTATAGYGGFLLGPPAIGAVASFSGLRPAFLLLILAMLAIVPIAVTSLRKTIPSVD